MSFLGRFGGRAGRPWRLALIALAAGALVWGLGRGGEDSPSFADRLRGIDGVASVKSGPHGAYVATVERPTRSARLATVIDELGPIIEGPHPAGGVVLAVGDVEVRRPVAMAKVFTDTRAGARAIVTATRNDDVESVSFMAHEMRISVAPHRDMLAVADSVLRTIARAGGAEGDVAWDAILSVTDGVRKDDDVWHVQIGLGDVESTSSTVHRLQKTLKRRGGRLLTCYVGQGDHISVTAEATTRRRLPAMRNAVRSVLPDGAEVTVAVDGVQVSGDRPKQALAQVRRLERAGASVSKITLSTDPEQTDRLVAAVDGGGTAQMTTVLSQLGRSDGLPADTRVELTLDRYGSIRPAMDLTGRARQLASFARPLVALADAGYRVVFEHSGSGTTRWPKADGVIAVFPTGDDEGSTINLTRTPDRQDLVDTLRSHPWPGTVVLQIYGLTGDYDQSHKDYYGLRFASTADGKARKELLPGQLRTDQPELSHSFAMSFLRAWNDTAG